MKKFNQTNESDYNKSDSKLDDSELRKKLAKLVSEENKFGDSALGTAFASG